MKRFNIARNSKRLVMEWHAEGKISDEILTRLFYLHPEWREA